MASENSPDQVFRGEPSMSSLILDLHIQGSCLLLAFCVFCIVYNAHMTHSQMFKKVESDLPAKI